MAFLQSGQLLQAASLAFNSNQPGQLLAVIDRLQMEGAASILGTAVSALSEEQIRKSLTILRDWNTNSRYAQAAQTLLNALLLSHSPKVCFHLCAHLVSSWPNTLVR